MKGYSSRRYAGIPLGLTIRRSIAKTWTFRLRKGNGFAGTRVGELIQDKYAYTVSDPNANHVGVGNKTNFAAAISVWQSVLTPAEKAEYNRRAAILRTMSGYNLFLREAMKGLVQMFVDRGDPASFDFETVDFTQDDAWHDLSLVAIIPLAAKLVLLDFDYRNAAANRHIELRKNGQTNNKNHGEMHTRVAAQDDHGMMVVAPDGNRVIEYKVSTAGWTHIRATVRGWWT